jgi:predicted DNA-binding antitoxin AbrB/MazE fold protein
MPDKLRAIYKSGIIEPTQPLKVAEGTEVYIVVPKSAKTTFRDEPIKTRSLATPEEEFRKKYPHVEVEPEFFKLVGCMTNAPSAVYDKELFIDAISEKYQE